MVTMPFNAYSSFPSSSQPSPSSFQIFQLDGVPFKIFLQKDIPDDYRAELEETIRAEGGIVVEKIPRRGFVVVQPGTTEAVRLQQAWRDADRPERSFVACEWIVESKERGRLVPQIFVKDAIPVTFHIHKTIANVPMRKEIAEKISLYGGNPDASHQDATVILASRDTDSFKIMLREYQGREDKFVEDLMWLEICIRQELYRHTPNTLRNPGGRRAGDERTPFTEEDEAKLCNWIASVIPFKESGGRTGNKIYMELISRAGRPGYEWVERHTWQSWRERYKKNSERLDQHIAAIVKLAQENGTIPRDRNQFGFFKLTEGRQTRRHRKRQASEEVADVEDTGPGDPHDDQEAQDNEWPIREGNEPPPNWAKSTIDDGKSLESRDRKRQKTGDAKCRTFVLAPANEAPAGPTTFSTATEFAADFGHQGPSDHVEREILSIARDQRFLSDEVRTYYQRNGDLLATRQRFERIRALIDNLP